MDALIEIYTCYGADRVAPIAPVGPTLTRPALRVIPRVSFNKPLWSADPQCKHYITYGRGGGVRCIRCSGWYCA